MENKNYNFRPELFNFLQKKEKEIPIHELPKMGSSLNSIKGW